MRQSVIILISLVLIAAFVLILLTNQQIFALLKNEDNLDASIVETPDSSQPVLAGGKVQSACQLLPEQSARVSFGSSGIIDEVLVKEGERVETGQVLARLDGYKQAEAEFISATRAANDAQEKLEKLKDNVFLSAAQALKDYRDAIMAEKNAQNLVKRLKDAEKTGDEIAQAEAALALARAQLRVAEETYERRKNGPDPQELSRAEEDIKEAIARKNAAEEALRGFELHAPFAGTVVELFLTKGEYAAPGSGIMMIADLDRFIVETTNLTELNILNVLPGEAATITFDAMRDKPFPGVVRSVQPIGKNVQGDILFKVTLDGDFAQDGLMWGMSCSLVIGE
jgi:multidrug resistance efflux pump